MSTSKLHGPNLGQSGGHRIHPWLPCFQTNSHVVRQTNHGLAWDKANFTKPSPNTTWAIHKLLLLGTVDDCTLGIRHDSPIIQDHQLAHHPQSRQTNPSSSPTIPGQPLNWCHVISPWFVFMLSQLLQDIWRGLHQSCWRNHGCGLWNLDAESSGSPGSYHHIFWRRPELSKHLVKSQSPHPRMFSWQNHP
jgi:hypothetical protein